MTETSQSNNYSNMPTNVQDAARMLRCGDVTSVELTRSAIERAEALDGALGVYLTRLDEYAMDRAQSADRDLANGIDRGVLQGITIGVKDILAMSECSTTAQSLVMDRTWRQGEDATVVSSLKAAGAVITGKVSLSEFAVGWPDPTKPFPVPRNPWDTRAWPGGSSSGTAVGVAAGLFLAGIGTDTGGSIRIPAAFCGVSGLKPTFGLVSSAGCVPLGFTLDHVGPLARNARDCRSILESIMEPSLRYRYGQVRLNTICRHGNRSRPLSGLRMGVVHADHFIEGSDPQALVLFDGMVDVFRSLGCELHDITLPLYNETRAANLLILQAEAFAYHRTNLINRWTDFFENTREMLSMGALMSGADYVQAQRVRRAAQRGLASIFQEVDLVVSPTLTVAAPAYGPGMRLDGSKLFDHVHTGYWNCTGHPGLAIPMGTNDSGLPLSMQIVGRPFEDLLVMETAEVMQGATEWHLRQPSLLTVSNDDGRPLPNESPVLATQGPDVGAVTIMLGQAGLPASPSERHRISLAYPKHKAGIESLYAAVECKGELPPAYEFRPELFS